MKHVTLAILIGFLGTSFAEEIFDAIVVYADAKVDTVFDVWEYYNREPVRMLCYIDGKARPTIPYAQIDSIVFGKSSNDPRMSTISIYLKTGEVKRGTLWSNDSMFGTDKAGNEWRGRIASLATVRFRPGSTPGSRRLPEQGPRSATRSQ